ncbi:uncharacterized protein KQ657_003622 [Scheffersomyces spartinae]|uniref:Uncharacterized protein n=1 Tax=Scheffersomyces spartinae TaxID=45513 RepID=A0A9P8AG58_9ASCO|nr:uncharacterized protein KQ657_003622 [Scheffersomyces spartinae]KAG7191271.1 hypothetical protein KQ657_003622 [Scheffersomyces spartinae]
MNIQGLISLLIVSIVCVEGRLRSSEKILFTGDSSNIGIPKLSHLFREATDSRRNEEVTIDTSKITHIKADYYLRDLGIINRDIIASECRINMNPKYRSILTPYCAQVLTNLLQYNANDVIRVKIEESLMALFKSKEDLSHFQFYDFGSILDPIECLLSYQEFGQIVLSMKFVEAQVEQVLRVTQGDTINTFSDSFALTIPLHGELQCKLGKSKTCIRSNATSKGSTYKLFDS